MTSDKGMKVYRALNLDNFHLNRHGIEVTPDQLIKDTLNVDQKLTKLQSEAEGLAERMMVLANWAGDVDKFLDVCNQIERRAKWGRKPQDAHPNEKWTGQPAVWRTYKSIISRAMYEGLMPFTEVQALHYEYQDRGKDRERVTVKGPVTLDTFGKLRECYRATSEAASDKQQITLKAGKRSRIAKYVTELTDVYAGLEPTRRRRLEKELKELLEEIREDL